jgi:hypothetical protein
MEEVMQHKIKNTRSSKRSVYTVTLEYSYTVVKDGSLSCVSGAGVTSNISSGGLGFYADHMLKTGQDLKVFSKSMSENPVQAVVRWCQKISDDMFKIGLMFEPVPVQAIQ